MQCAMYVVALTTRVVKQIDKNDVRGLTGGSFVACVGVMGIE